MNDYPHVKLLGLDPVFRSSCRCGAVNIVPQASMHPPYAPAPQTWGKDCPAALHARITELEARPTYEAAVRACARIVEGSVVPENAHRSILALLEPTP